MEIPITPRAKNLNGHANRGGTQLAPHWDPDRRELSVGGTIVKKFRRPAALQEAILALFAELGWPPRIDDPLHPRAGRNQKERLRVTIAKLNRGHRQRLIRFYSDGRGQGICYELIGSA